MVGPRWGLVAAAAVALLPSLGADPAPYATPYARLVGKSKIELARSMHGGAMLHRDAPKASASCRRVGLSLDGQTIRDQNRSILIMVQTMTASKSNLCEGSRADWRDGMAQCLHLLTGLRVVAHNDDGTCADCGTFQRTACDEGGRPPALVVVLGGGEDKRMRFHCTNTYCGATGAPFVSTIAVGVALRRWFRRYNAEAVAYFVGLLDNPPESIEEPVRRVYAYAAKKRRAFEDANAPRALPDVVDLVCSGGGFKVCLAGGLALALRDLGVRGERFAGASAGAQVAFLALNDDLDAALRWALAVATTLRAYPFAYPAPLWEIFYRGRARHYGAPRPGRLFASGTPRTRFVTSVTLAGLSLIHI